MTPLYIGAIVNHMVNYSTKQLDPVFSALADPTRRLILERLTNGEATVTEVAHSFDTSLPAISRHIKKLEAAGLVARRKDGRIHHLRLVAPPLEDAMLWMQQVHRFWEIQLDALEQFLKEAPHG